jgi:tape measure domain-containing protein
MQPGGSNVNIHTSLTGQAQTIAGLNATSAAVARLRAQIVAAGEDTKFATLRQQGYNQAWFTVRRLVYASTLAIGAAGVGVVAFGLKFNSTMQQNMVAFTHFLGSTQAATAYLDKLYDLAAKTPFEFEDLTAATKKLIAFGYSGDQAYRTMVDIGDAAAGLGVSKEGIDRMTLAFGQMRTNGRILGGELRQLSEVGINARKYLQQAFNLTPDQMANIGRLHIPAEQGIEAILRGMENEFGGFAEKQANTFQGMLSTIHDYAQKLFGTITKPLFDKLSTDYLPRMVTLTKDLAAAFESGGWTGMAQLIANTTGHSEAFMQVWGRIVSISKSLSIIWRQELWPAIVNAAKALAPLLLLLWPLSWALKFMADHTTTFKIALSILLIYLIWTRVYLVLSGKALHFYATMGWRALVMLKLGLIPQLQRLIFYLFASDRAANGQFQRMGRLRWAYNNWRTVLVSARTAMLRYAVAVLVAGRAMALFLLTNPIGWAILIITTLAILYMKWDWFHDKVNTIFFWIKDHWKLLAAIFLGPLFLVGYVMVRFWDTIWDKIQWIWDKAKAVWDWVKGKLGWLFPDEQTATSFHAAPGLRGTSAMGIGSGGQVPRIGNTKVNAVDTSTLKNNFSPEYVQVGTKIQLDRKEIAEAVSTHKLYKDATR